MQRCLIITVAILTLAACGWAAPAMKSQSAGSESPAVEAATPEQEKTKAEKSTEAKDKEGDQEKAKAEKPAEAKDKAGEALAAPGKEEPEQGWHFSTWKTGGRADYQVSYMKQTVTGMSAMENTQGKLMSLELESTATLNNGERDILELALQWPYYTQMKGVDGRGKPMHFFNAYGILKLGLGKPNIRFGQFVVPFGNLPYYETHTVPLQSLFPQSLGVRIQRGVSVEGFVSHFDYWVAVMGDDHAREGVVRIARRFDLSKGTLTAGFSGLYGVDMPCFSTLLDPMMDSALAGMPLSHSVNFTDKKRFALDAEYSMGKELWRGELILGRDSENRVNGQFLQWSHALSDKDELMVQIARWNQPSGARVRFGGWYGRKLDKYFTARLWAERSLGEEPGEMNVTHGNETTIGLQCIMEIPRLFGR